MPLARHALNDFLGDRWIVFAALETFIEQFDSESANLLPVRSVICSQFRPRPKLNIGNCAGRTVPLFLQLLVAQRFSSFGYSNNFDEIVRGYGGARLAAEDVVKARERTAFVIDRLYKKRIADTPPGENNRQ